MSLSINSIHFDFHDLKIANLHAHVANLLSASAYKPHDLKSKKLAQIAKLEQISFADQNNNPDLVKDLNNIQAIHEGALLTKQLANLPSNICTPNYMAQQAIALADSYSSLKVNVQDEKDIIAAGMGAFASVSRGSIEDAKLVTIEYYGDKKSEQPYVIIGKGVTFDTGGISIKP